MPSGVADMQGIYNELSGKILAGSDGLFKICVNDVVQSVNRLKAESQLKADFIQII